MKKIINLKHVTVDYADKKSEKPKGFGTRFFEGTLRMFSYPIGSHARLVKINKYRVESLTNLTTPRVDTMLTEEEVDKIITDGDKELTINIQRR